MLWNQSPSSRARCRISFEVRSRLVSFMALARSSDVAFERDGRRPLAAAQPGRADIERLGLAFGPRGEEVDRLAVTMQRADIHIGLSGVDAVRLSAAGDIGVDQGSD